MNFYEWMMRSPMAFRKPPLDAPERLPARIEMLSFRTSQVSGA
jgi:hypothetical protein